MWALSSTVNCTEPNTALPNTLRLSPTRQMFLTESCEPIAVLSTMLRRCPMRTMRRTDMEEPHRVPPRTLMAPAILPAPTMLMPLPMRVKLRTERHEPTQRDVEYVGTL